MMTNEGKYNSIICSIFQEKYQPGMTSILFKREEFVQKARAFGFEAPKNLGDVVYSYKYRKSLPSKIADTAPRGYYWRIRNVGKAAYEFLLEEGAEFIEPDPILAIVKLPDSTPSIVKKYSITDEQALLTIVRYNRLIDIFLGISCYSLQNHLRTTVNGIGQIETDEIYVGMDKKGRQFIIPVQAKGGSDKLGITQIEQDFKLCEQKYPELICRAIACQFVTSDTVAMFEFSFADGKVVKENERHYKLVDAKEISDTELRRYCI